MMIFLWKQHCEMTSQNKKRPWRGDESERRVSSARRSRFDQPPVNSKSFDTNPVSTTWQKRLVIIRFATQKNSLEFCKSASLEVQLKPSATSKSVVCHLTSQARVTAWNHRRFGSKRRFLRCVSEKLESYYQTESI